MTLDEAVAVAATGDVWLFRGASVADFAIRTVTNAPVNHVGMVVALDDLPPLLWHAELGRSLPDVWTGEHQRGVQLHKLADAVTTWKHRYGQRGWVRQLEGTIEREHEDRLMEVIQQHDGRAVPDHARAGRPVGQGPRPSPPAAVTGGDLLRRAGGHHLPGMGLLPTERPPSWYDPGRFWSGDHLELVPPFSLGGEIAVSVPDPPEEETAEPAPDATQEVGSSDGRSMPRLRLPGRRRPG